MSQVFAPMEIRIKLIWHEITTPNLFLLLYTRLKYEKKILERDLSLRGSKDSMIQEGQNLDTT